jgi:hypothetical protein
LEVQGSIKATDQDRRLGQDVYCLVDETGAVHYGGIKSWSLVGYELQIRLDDDASRVLDTAEYRIHLPDDAAITTANQAMKLIVGQPGRST